MGRMLAKIFLLLLLCLSAYADEQVYFMPDEAKEAMHELLKSIDHAKNSIDIAIYSFTNKEIAKRLKNAAKRGVKITIIFDRESNLQNQNSQLGVLAKYQNIDVYVLEGKPYKKTGDAGKMHMKIMLIDAKRVIFGSANFSQSAFGNNYEVLYIIDSYALYKKFWSFFEQMHKRAKPY